jgi:hypothetical protein
MSGPHCNCAYDECTVTSCKQCGAPIPEADKRATQHDLCLQALGNGVVPQQAALALELLLGRAGLAEAGEAA